MKDVILNQEKVELYKILKFEGIVGSGGEAKFVIAEGRVLVNGEVETQKRKKIVDGDTIEIGEKIIKARFQETDVKKVSTKQLEN